LRLQRDVADRAAGNYRFATANPSRGGLAACAPQKAASPPNRKVGAQ
jgi:hypothetical protein